MDARGVQTVDPFKPATTTAWVGRSSPICRLTDAKAGPCSRFATVFAGCIAGLTEILGGKLIGGRCV